MNTLSMVFFKLQEIALPINLVCLLVIFIGGLYVAIHSRIIPMWVRTPLWYLGATSFIVSLSIVFEWTLGSEFVFSYSKFGSVGEIIINMILAIFALLMLFHTVFKDVCEMKKRRRRRYDD